MRRMDRVLSAYATAANLATTYPLSAMCVLALGPVLIVGLSRSPVGAMIVIGLAIMGVGLAVEVTQSGVDVRPFESPVLRMAFALWGALWPIAIGFLIFGRPPAYAEVGNVASPGASAR
jgi:hypothetical protein